jgi:hypothetical protein
MHAPQCKPTCVGPNFAIWVVQPHTYRSAVAAQSGLADFISGADGRHAPARPAASLLQTPKSGVRDRSRPGSWV